MDTTPYWFEHLDLPSYPKLDTSLKVDVLIVGGGITGVTTAYLLNRQGLKVALIDRGRICGNDTKHTSAHVTYMTDTRLSDLIASCSRKETRIAWEAGLESMKLIRSIVELHAIDCNLEIVPGYLEVMDGGNAKREAKRLQDEAMCAREFGFDVEYEDIGPVNRLPALRFADQMQFHPLRYVSALARIAASKGAHIYERTEAESFEAKCAVAGGHRIEFNDVVIATHVPLQANGSMIGSSLFQTKLALYSTYVIAAQIPEGGLIDMIWSDTADPFDYLRIENFEGQRYAILGGEDHKTGQESHTEKLFARLEEKLAKLVPEAQVTHRWSGQVIETVDGLPFIGRSGDGEFIATGYSGNGMTFGTVAAMMARDAITGVTSSWEEVFNPSRKGLSASAAFDYVAENKDYPIRMITGRMRVPNEDPEALTAGCAKVVDCNGQHVAAFRDEHGELHTLSAVCPHMGCIVAWNEAEMTWDCPCHGSRFRATGEVFGGPAEVGLKPFSNTP